MSTDEMTPDQLAAKVLYEGGVTYAQIAEQFKVSEATVNNWRVRFRWSRDSGETETATENVEPDVEIIAPTFDAVDDEIERLKLELAHERRLRIEAEARAQANLPFVDVSAYFYDEPAQVIELFGLDRMKAIVTMNMREVNKKRSEEGLPRLELADDEMTHQVYELATEIVSRRKNSYEGSPTRVIKLWNPKANNGAGSLVQLPVEDQVNNHAGSRGDAIYTYTEKGFKVVDPMVCAAMDCWEKAATDANGQPTLLGYCSEAQRDFVEANKQGKDRNPALSMANPGGAYRQMA